MYLTKSESLFFEKKKKTKSESSSKVGAFKSKAQKNEYLTLFSPIIEQSQD